jgi:hypothetical protein
MVRIPETSLSNIHNTNMTTSQVAVTAKPTPAICKFLNQWLPTSRAAPPTRKNPFPRRASLKYERFRNINPVLRQKLPPFPAHSATLLHITGLHTVEPESLPGQSSPSQTNGHLKTKILRAIPQHQTQILLMGSFPHAQFSQNSNSGRCFRRISFAPGSQFSLPCPATRIRLLTQRTGIETTISGRVQGFHPGSRSNCHPVRCSRKAILWTLQRPAFGSSPGIMVWICDKT